MKRYSAAILILMVCIAQVYLAAQQKEAKGLKVTEAKLGKDVKERKIVDETTTFTVNDKAYFWIRVTGGPSDSITVTWKTGDQSYPAKLNIGGSPWRTWSYKTLATAGDWTVTVTDPEGKTLKELSFKVEEAMK